MPYGFNPRGLTERLQGAYGGGRFSNLQEIAKTNPNMTGYTGTEQNIANMTGRPYVNPRSGVTTPVDPNYGNQVQGNNNPYFKSDAFGDQLTQWNAGQNAQTNTASDAPGSDYYQSQGFANDVNQYYANNPEQYGDALSGIYTNQLGREGDQAGYDFYLNKLQTGAMTLDEVRQHMNASTEGVRYDENQELQSYLGPEDYGMTSANAELTTGENVSTQYIDDSEARVKAYIDEAMGGFDPYQQTGEMSNELIQRLLSGDQSAFYEDPGYQYRLAESQKATAGMAGGLPSGATLSALQENAEGLAAQGYNDYTDFLTGRSDAGLEAAGGAAAVGQTGAGYAARAGETRGDYANRAAELRAQNRYMTGEGVAGDISAAAATTAGYQTAEARDMTTIVGQSSEALDNLIADTTDALTSEQRDWLENMDSTTRDQMTSLMGLWMNWGGEQENTTGFMDFVNSVTSSMSDLGIKVK